MYCINCGAKNDDDARFCVECGEQLNNGVLRKKIKVIEKPSHIEQIKIVGKNSEETRKKIKIIPIVILLILAIVVVTFPKLIISSHAEKKIIKEFMEAEMTGDAEKIIDILPEEILEMVKTEGGMSRNELAEEMRKQFDSVIGTLESMYGKDWKYSYKINNIKKVSQEDLEDIKDTYREELGKEVDISKAKTVEIEVNVTGNEMENTVSLEVNLIKIKNKWYLDFASLESLM